MRSLVHQASLGLPKLDMPNKKYHIDVDIEMEEDKSSLESVVSDDLDDEDEDETKADEGHGLFDIVVQSPSQHFPDFRTSMYGRHSQSDVNLHDANIVPVKAIADEKEDINHDPA